MLLLGFCYASPMLSLCFPILSYALPMPSLSFSYGGILKDSDLNEGGGGPAPAADPSIHPKRMITSFYFYLLFLGWGDSPPPNPL